jgi:hypothetical protein
VCEPRAVRAEADRRRVSLAAPAAEADADGSRVAVPFALAAGPTGPLPDLLAAHAGACRVADGGQAVRRRRRDRPGPALGSEAQRTPMWMRRLRGRIAEDVLGETQQRAESLG